MSRIKRWIASLVGKEVLIEFASQIIARSIDTMAGKFEADLFLFNLGHQVREKIPGEQIENNIGHLIGSFKAGLLGKDLEETEKEIDKGK